MTYAKKVDVNQSEIVAKFRELGASVYVASGVGHGFPDIVVGFNNQHTILVEIKRSQSAKFTDAQQQFMSKWTGGPVVRIHDIEGVTRLINLLTVRGSPEV